MNTPVNDNHDPDDNCVLPNVLSKDVFQILNNYLLQHEKKNHI